VFRGATVGGAKRPQPFSVIAIRTLMILRHSGAAPEPVAGGRSRAHTRRPARRPVLLALGLGGCLLSCTLSAADIYKWVDEHGRVHYGDRPPGADIPRMPLEPAERADPDLSERRDKQKKLLEVLAEEREEETRRLEQARQEDALRRENCERARRSLESVRDAGYIFESSADPDNPQILSDAERDEYTRSLESDVKNWCR